MRQKACTFHPELNESLQMTSSSLKPPQTAENPPVSNLCKISNISPPPDKKYYELLLWQSLCDIKKAQREALQYRQYRDKGGEDKKDISYVEGVIKGWANRWAVDKGRGDVEGRGGIEEIEGVYPESEIGVYDQ